MTDFTTISMNPILPNLLELSKNNIQLKGENEFLTDTLKFIAVGGVVILGAYIYVNFIQPKQNVNLKIVPPNIKITKSSREIGYEML